MKKLLTVILVLALTLPVALAESIDLSGMSFDELVALRDRINLAIWQSDEWQEVTVPQGVWKVGEDIPAGHWTIKCAPEWRNTHIVLGNALSDGGDGIDAWNSDRYTYERVYNPDHRWYEVGDGVTEYSFNVKDGDYIVIDDGEAIFMPYAGKPDLGFK